MLIPNFSWFISQFLKTFFSSFLGSLFIWRISYSLFYEHQSWLISRSFQIFLFFFKDFQELKKDYPGLVFVKVIANISKSQSFEEAMNGIKSISFMFKKKSQQHQKVLFGNFKRLKSVVVSNVHGFLATDTHCFYATFLVLKHSEWTFFMFFLICLVVILLLNEKHIVQFLSRTFKKFKRFSVTISISY